MSIRKIAPYVLLAAAVLYGITPLWAQNAPITKLPVKTGAPEGFEELNAPHETSIDLFYGGLNIGSYRAVYTSRSIAFALPDEIVNKIPAIKHDMVMHVQNALTGDLNTNADKICGHIAQKDCGKLQPDVAGVIFYEDSFRAELFISPSMLAEQDTHADKILPPAPDVFSSVHSFNGNIISDSGQGQSYSLQNNSTIAYGAGRLNMVGSVSDVQKQITTMTASLDKWGLDNRAGFFDSHAMQLLPQIHMSGVSVGTSLNTNLALRDAAGSHLSIFLPTRSWVSLIYNNVIYSTDFYEAGNQVLNTDALPEGAYEVTLRIRDINGGQTEEKRFFAKNFEIPPADTPIYFGQVGSVRDTAQTGRLPNIGSGFIATGGTVQRFTDNIGIDGDFMMLDSKVFTETGAFLLLPPDHQLRGSLLASSEGDYGFGLSYLGYGFDKKLAIASDARAIFAAAPGLTTDPFDPIPATTQQVSAGISYQINNPTNVGFQGNYAKSSFTKSQYAFGPTLNYDFWRNGTSNLTLTANSTQTQDGMAHAIMINFNMRLGAWGYSSEGDVRAGSRTAIGGTGLSKGADGRITWNDDQDPGRLTVIGLEGRHDDISNNYIADMEHRSQYGNIKLVGSQTHNSSGSNNFYSGNVGFGIAQSGSDVSWGGNQQQTSGFIVKTTGNSEDVPMRVMVNNSERTEFKTGDSTALFLSPYQTYNVSIKPVQSAAIDYDGAVKHVTLYPGNILPMIWDINRINVVLGHVALPDGTPVVNARLEESRNLSITDEEGMFQGELLELKTLTFKRAEEQAPTAGTVYSNDMDIFSILPPFHRHRNHPSTMSAEAQNKAIQELYGTDDEPPSTQASTPATAPPPTDPGHTQAPAVPLKKLLSALRCQVVLPETKETNGVYIYSETLTCTPIAFEDEKKNELKGGTGVDDDSALNLKNIFNPKLTPTSELAYAVLHGGESAEFTVVRDVARAPTYRIVEVQLGAYRTESEALAMRNLLMKKYGELSGKTPYIIKANLGPKGIYYRLRIGNFGNTLDAHAFCSTLAARGQACNIVIEETKAEPAVKTEICMANPLPGAVADPLAIHRTMAQQFISLPTMMVAQNAPPITAPVVAAAMPVSSVEVQLGAYRTQAKAESERILLIKKYGELAGKSPYIVKADLGKKGVYYRLRVSNFRNAGEARNFCSALSAKGQGCNIMVEETKQEQTPVPSETPLPLTMIRYH